MGTKAIISLACIDLEIRWVYWKVTWPWRAKSRVKAMHLAYMPLTLLTQETMQNKNSHVSGMYRARDKIGHLWGQVTLTYKVKRQGHIRHILFHLLYRNLTIETNRIFKIQSITRMWLKTVLSSPEQQKAKFIHENIKIPWWNIQLYPCNSRMMEYIIMLIFIFKIISHHFYLINETTSTK